MPNGEKNRIKENSSVQIITTWILQVLRGVRQTKHPVKVGCQEAVPTLLVPAQLLTVMKTTDNRHHGFKGYLGQVGCGTQT